MIANTRAQHQSDVRPMLYIYLEERDMARMTSKAATRAGRSDPVKPLSISPETRLHMIGEAAYYRYVERGFESGHELDDWLAAEADFEEARLMEQASRR